MFSKKVTCSNIFRLWIKRLEFRVYRTQLEAVAHVCKPSICLVEVGGSIRCSSVRQDISIQGSISWHYSSPMLTCTGNNRLSWEQDAQLLLKGKECCTCHSRRSACLSCGDFGGQSLSGLVYFIAFKAAGGAMWLFARDFSKLSKCLLWLQSWVCRAAA